MTDVTHFTSKLQGQRVLIAGGSSGIGYAVAEGALEYGMEVTIASSSEAKVKAAVSSLQKSYPSAAARIRGEVVNLGDPTTLEANVEALLKRVGQLDHIINTAGGPTATSNGLADTTIEPLRNAPSTRGWAALMLAKHGGEMLKAGGPRASLIMTTGSLGEKPPKGWAAAALQASGTWGLTKGLAMDLAPARVNAVSPGAVDTPLWDSLPESYRATAKESMAARTTTGKIGEARDVAEAYLYLMRDANITGTVISTNGGWTII